MTDTEHLHTSILNQISSEIIILDKDLQGLWINESALNNGWSNCQNIPIQAHYPESLNSALFTLLRKSQDELSSFSKRDMEITNKANEKRIIDMTVSCNSENSHIILEVKCVDSINKIIDSTKIFSTQKIAANLARTLAHEVKNPLSGIKGSAQILSKKLEDGYSKKFLKIIIDETDRLNGIVTKILTPPQKPSQEKFNIHSALEKVYALADADISPNLKLRRDYDPSIPELMGDENLFIQAILNIVKNAQQALGDITNAEIKINELRKFNFAIFAISLGIISSTLLYSSLSGEFCLVVPIQKKQSLPLISSTWFCKLLKSVLKISTFGLLISGALRTNNLILE